MNARTRRRKLRRTRFRHDSQLARDRWQAAVGIRTEWAAHGLSTAPAERAAAEAAITGLYSLIDRPAPRFVWVASPWEAVGLLPDGGPVRLRADAPLDETSPWYVACRLATLGHALRESLDRRLGRPPGSPWRPPGQLLAVLDAGGWDDDLLDAGVRAALVRSVRDGVYTPLRAALVAATGEPGGLSWHGQHDVAWIAYCDALRRLGRRVFDRADSRQLDLWAAVARSCGWWWPTDGWCVVTERTAEVHVEAAPGALYGETRAHNPRGMAIAYPDGTGVHAWHGTAVPAWVITEPTVERVFAEPNVEVRRCAIERLGWDTFIDRAALRRVASAPDPGNPGCDLHLYDVPSQVWGAPGRVLLAVNGSVERDGHRRRYGLSVPADIDDPVAAAGWSYGLSATQYAQLLRRT